MTQNDSLAFTLDRMVQKNCPSIVTSESPMSLYSLAERTPQELLCFQNTPTNVCQNNSPQQIGLEPIEIPFQATSSIPNKPSHGHSQSSQQWPNRLKAKTELATIEQEHTFKESGVQDKSSYGPDGPPLSLASSQTAKNLSKQSFYFNILQQHRSRQNLLTLHTDSNQTKNSLSIPKKKCIRIKWPKKQLRIQSLATEFPGQTSRNLTTRSSKERISTMQSLSPRPIPHHITLMTSKSQQKINRKFLCLTPKKCDLKDMLRTPSPASGRKGIRVISSERKQNASKQKVNNFQAVSAVPGVPVRNIEISTKRTYSTKSMSINPLKQLNGFPHKILVKSKVRQQNLRWKH